MWTCPGCGQPRRFYCAECDISKGDSEAQGPSRASVASTADRKTTVATIVGIVLGTLLAIAGVAALVAGASAAEDLGSNAFALDRALNTARYQSAILVTYALWLAGAVGLVLAAIAFVFAYVSEQRAGRAAPAAGEPASPPPAYCQSCGAKVPIQAQAARLCEACGATLE